MKLSLLLDDEYADLSSSDVFDDYIPDQHMMITYEGKNYMIVNMAALGKPAVKDENGEPVGYDFRREIFNAIENDLDLYWVPSLYELMSYFPYTWANMLHNDFSKTHPPTLYLYARDIVCGKWEEAEPILKKSRHYWVCYQHMLNNNIIESEYDNLASQDNECKLELTYHNDNVVITYDQKLKTPKMTVNGKKLPEEAAIKYMAVISEEINLPWVRPLWMLISYFPDHWIQLLHNPPDFTGVSIDAIVDYAETVLRSEWPEAENVIIKDLWLAYTYCVRVKCRWPELEHELLASGDMLRVWRYIRGVIMGRWPEAEPMLQQNSYYWDKYQWYLEYGV